MFEEPTIQGFSDDKITDDGFYKNYRWSDDHSKKSSTKILTDDPTITLKRFWKLLLTTTDDPTITIRFFCRTLPMIRRSHFGFLPNATDDPTITIRFFCQTLPMIQRSQIGFFAERYRWSDDQMSGFLSNATDDPIRRSIFGFLLNATDYPTIKFWFFGRTLRDLTPWNQNPPR